MNPEVSPSAGEDRPASILESAMVGLFAFGLDYLVSGIELRAARRRKRAAAAAVDPDLSPEPGPGLYRCRSKHCGYRFWRDDKRGDAHWFGPIYQDGTCPNGGWHTWEDVDQLWGDCVGRGGLILENNPPWPGWTGKPVDLPD